MLVAVVRPLAEETAAVTFSLVELAGADVEVPYRFSSLAPTYQCPLRVVRIRARAYKLKRQKKKRVLRVDISKIHQDALFVKRMHWKADESPYIR